MATRISFCSRPCMAPRVTRSGAIVVRANSGHRSVQSPPRSNLSESRLPTSFASSALRVAPAASPRTLFGTQRGPRPLAAQKKQYGSFEEMLVNSETPVLVDFYATWCGPCQMLSPVLSALSKRLEGKMQVVKIDSDKYGAIASQFQVTALPTIILFKGGKPVDRMEGMFTESQLFDRVSYHL